MMHHPNMHHQPMSGHPPQHMPGHQGLPGHHQMPPHQMHRENRHVTLTRVPLGPSGAGGGMGAHAHSQALSAMGGVPVHHAPGQRPPHAVRPMPHHHTPAQHHSVPPQQMKPMRRPYGMGGAYPGGGHTVMAPPYAPPHPRHPPPPQHTHTGLRRAMSPAKKKLMPDFGPRRMMPPAISVKKKPMPDFDPRRMLLPDITARKKVMPDFVTPAQTNGPLSNGVVVCEVVGQTTQTVVEPEDETSAAPGDTEAARPAPATQANSKEKTPMCLVNELARYNKIKHQYRLTSETGPAHKKVFTVTLRLGDTEEYTAEGSSIKRAQHAAASAALAGTGFPPPPPRAPHQHHPAHNQHRHAGTVMPTVELNALAMKLCQPAVYTSVPAVTTPVGVGMGGGAGVGVGAGPGVGVGVGAGPGVGVGVTRGARGRGLRAGGGVIYRVRVAVGGRAWLGEGPTPQAARHDAAAQALHDLRQPAQNDTSANAAAPTADAENGDANPETINAEAKSPVSLVHELALKRNLSVEFAVKSERGPPHMRVFVTSCTVGELETDGEGNGKKVSKRRAAERMLDEMRRRWPPAMLRPRPAHDARRHPPAKKKPRNLIKEGGVTSTATSGLGGDNPISRLAVARHAVRARSPQYRVLEERGQARRREFLVQCDAPPHSATGLGPNKKTAKRRAAHNVLLAMEMSTTPSVEDGTSTSPTAAGATTSSLTIPLITVANDDSKRKEGERPGSGGAAGEIRQPVPGVLMMDYHQRSGQPTPPNGISETSATGGGGGSTPGAKDQLMYLSQLLGFSVQFSDFPKRNHGEYLSLVSLSTEPPVMCHGGGPSTAHSHELCSRAALRALALMGLDGASPAQPHPKTSVVSNGVTE